MQRYTKKVSARKGRKYGISNNLRKGNGGRRKARRGNRKGETIMFNPQAIVADRFVTKLKYTLVGTLTGGPNYDATQLYGNSPYDPIVGASTPLATGFNQLSALYKNHVVTGSSVVVQLCNTAVNGGLMTVVPTTSTTSFAGSPALAQNWAHSKTTMLGPLTSSKSYGRIKHYIATNVMYGKTSEAIKDEDSFAGAYNSRPSDLFTWHVILQACDGLSAMSADSSITITYYVQFYNRVDVTAT